MTGVRVVITGPTSGLGRAAAQRFASLNADLLLVGRSVERTEATAHDLARRGDGHVQVVIADMSELGEVANAATAVRNAGPVDVLIHNAGALLSDYTTTSDGFEVTYACHVLGPFRMTHDLLPSLRQSGRGRVLTMTSGGMYSERLDAQTVQMGAGDYDGVVAYARAKRAQVVLTEQWARKYPEVAAFHTVHPGWADTPGVASSLPRFHSIIGPLLRTAEQGADTICWLASASEAQEVNGRLWLDRRIRQTSKVPWTITGQAQADALWDRVSRDTGT
ncbi:MAG: SDR family NAD(P)-dependent oxidoreductase [Candidatus Nanopelagicales bacterium]